MTRPKLTPLMTADEVTTLLRSVYPQLNDDFPGLFGHSMSSRAAARCV